MNETLHYALYHIAIAMLLGWAFTRKDKDQP